MLDDHDDGCAQRISVSGFIGGGLSGFLLTEHDILFAAGFDLPGRERKVRQATTHVPSAWAAAHAAADEVEVPYREVGLTILDFRF